MFETDFFISYSHKDDEPLPGETEGWVSDLHKALQVRVGQLLGEPPRIWRDPLQGGNEYFSDAFLKQLRKTAALVSVLSPSYFTSPWCPRELEAFFEACQSSGGLRRGDRARIFAVVKTQIPEPERIPPQLREFLGYEFYAVDDMTKRVREYWRAFGEEAKLKFVQKADDLAQDISRLLRQLRDEEQPPSEMRKQKGFVYLAETSSDLKEARESLYRDLDRSGYEVLPDRPLPATASGVEAAVREQVTRCRLSVHMIGRNYGVVPEGTTLSIPVLQNDLAAEHSKQVGLSRLVWIPPGQTIDDERQSAFIDRFQTAPELQGKMDLLGGSLEDLKTAVHRSLAPCPAQPETVRESPREGMASPRVYLICDQQDQAMVQPIKDLLFEGGCEPILPLFDGDETDLRQDHEDNLRLCDAVLLYWGMGREAWRRKKHNEIFYKSAGLGRAKGVPPTLLYIAPPASRDKELFRSREVMIVRQPPEGTPEVPLAAFLEQLQGGEPKAPHEPV